MRNFILHGDILIVEAKINEEDYIIGVRWQEPNKPYADTWKLESFANKETGEKNLTKQEIDEFMETINANWNWHVEK